MLSHPGYSLVQVRKEWFVTKPFSGGHIGLGPNHETLRVQLLQDGRINLHKKEGSLRVYSGKLVEGQPIVVGTVALWYKLLYPQIQHSIFTVNDDGSISPTKAPHLAFGSYLPVHSSSNLIID